jgi:predicted nucleic acid-binding protein
MAIYANDGEVRRLRVNIQSQPENAGRLLELAAESSQGMQMVAKSVIHYECLGDRELYPVLKSLILRLEELEDSNAKLRWDQDVASTLTATLTDRKGDLSARYVELHQWRTLAASEILEEIAKKRGAKVVAPLLASLQEPNCSEAARGMLERLRGIDLGQGDPVYLRGLISVGTAALHNADHQEHTNHFLGKIIDERATGLIYFVAPLLAATNAPATESTAKSLLERMRDKHLGQGDPRCLKELIRVGTAALRAADQQEYTIHFLGKVIDEGENNLIYLVGPLIAATKSRTAEPAKALLEMMKGKHLGKGDAECMAKLIDVGVAALYSIDHQNRQECAAQFLCKVIDEGGNNLIYFVAPLLAMVTNREVARVAKDLLNEMWNEPLGKGDAECMAELIRVGIASLSNLDRQRYAVHFLGKVIDEGENNLIYFVAPLLAAARDESTERMAKTMLERMKGKRMGNGTGDVLARMEQAFSTARHSPDLGGYVKAFAGKLREEGIALKVNTDYEPPSSPPGFRPPPLKPGMHRLGRLRRI